MAYNPAQPFANSTSGSPYDYMRQKATQDAGNQESQGQDAITRRFAAMGGLNSGANIQAMTQNSRDAQQRNQDAQGQINLGEQQGALPYAQMQQQESQFSRGQSLEGQKLAQQHSEFGSEMGAKNRALDLESSQQGMDAATNAFNEKMAAFQANHSGGMFGGGGPLGLGNGIGGHSPFESMDNSGNSGDSSNNGKGMLWGMR